jgi:hypothetical protein
MSPWLKYSATGAGAVVIGVGALWPFLDPAGRTGVLIAATVALTVQIGAFAVLMHFRGRATGFLAAWAGGMAVRMLAVAMVAVGVVSTGMEGGVPTLLSLAGFFFGLLLLEPVFFRGEPSKTVEA